MIHSTRCALHDPPFSSPVTAVNKIGQPIVTQQMIADAAGVHLSTVSLALRNDRRLPPETRRRIQEIAQRLGYSPNPLVSLLMSRVRRRNSGYRGTLGYVHTVPEDTPRLKGRVHQNFRLGARRRAADLGYNLDEFYFTPQLSMRRFVAMLQARNIAGLVIEHTPSDLCPGRTLPFDISPFAAASLGVPLARPQLHYVANDQYMRAILAARELLALGYRRLGLVIYDNFDSAMAHRCSAGFWAVQEYIPGLAALPICRVRGNNHHLLREWITRHQPDAILGTHYSIPTLASAPGQRVPEDIGWAHLDWIPEYQPAAGVYGNSEHTGAAAVELVVSQLHRGEAGPPAHAMSYLVSGTWQPGKTVRRVGPPLDLDTAFFSDLLRT
jgi:DNA-binding LacI/PurR family transcriptional regulator